MQTSCGSCVSLLLVTLLGLFHGSTGQCYQNGVSELSASYGPSSKKSMVSPGYPNQYPDNCRYDWLITADPGFIIKLEVEDIELESNDGCTYDYVEVFDGNSGSAPIIRKFCTPQDSMLLSTGRYMLVKFSSDGSQTRKGFNFTYQAISWSSTGQCSQNGVSELSASYGPSSKKSMVSPGYPDRYPNNCRYDWLITADPGFVIELEVEDIELESNDGCTYDYVEVFDGNSGSAPIIRKFCTPQDSMLLSTGRYMLVKFSSDGSERRRGFNFTYQAVSGSSTGQCSQNGVSELSASYGPSSKKSMVSPGYPNQYPDNCRYDWLITADPGFIIELEVENIELESNYGCTSDYVEVFDGNSGSAPIIRKFCTPQDSMLLSTGRYMLVKFSSDGSERRRGFNFTYQAVSETTHYQCTRRTKELKADWNGTWSSLYSPGYPYYYENDLRCGWRIVTDYAGYVIKLEAISVNLEVSDACEYDSVKVYDGGSPDGTLIRTLCSAQNETLYSRRSSMYILFQTDGSVSRTGFYLKYTAVDPSVKLDLDRCGTSSSPVRLVAKYDTLRTLTSPGYPNHYDNNLHCVWRIEVDSSWLVVKLRTSTVSLEEEDNCQYDALTVYDGSTQHAPVLSRICHDTRQTLYSSGRYMTIAFTTDVSGYERGFVVSYEGVPSTDVPTTTPKSDSSPSDSGNTGAVLAVAFTCVGVLGIGLIVLYCCCCHCMRKRTNSGPTAGTVQFSTHQTPTVPTAPTSNTTIPVINNSVFMLATPTSPSSPTLYYPGAFAAAGTTNPAYSSNGDAPPSYFSLQFDNSSSDGATQQGPVAPKTPPNMGAPPSYTEAIQLQTQPSASPVPSAPEL